jgi:hypothetical protein
MTERPPSRRIEQPFYAVTWERALKDYADGLLTPRGLIYCFFRIHLPPGCEQNIEVDQLCKSLGIHRATYYRAIGALEYRGRLNVRAGQMIISIPEDATTQGLSQQSDTQSQTSDSQSQSCDTGSQQSDSQSQPSDSQSQSCDLWKTPEPLQDGDCRSPANVPNKQTDPLKKQTNKQEPTPHPVCSGIDREGLGTNDPESRNFVQTADISDLVQRIRTAGVEPNKTLLKTLVMVKQREGSAAARTVENALSALREQQSHSTVQNPGGFLRSALVNKYTANRAKKDAREHRQAPTPHPPDEDREVAAINQAINQGDRAFALAKLQALWNAGWHDQVEEWCITWKPYWGFIVTESGVVDGTGVKDANG